MKDKLEIERVEHNKIYEKQQAWLLDSPLSWDRYYQMMSIPPHQGGSLYGLDHKIFLDYLDEELRKFQNQEIRILDYGCGTGALAIALAGKGHQVDGFDLSDKGIEIAAKAAERSGVEEKTNFVVANAEELPYPDETFDLVIGKAVLHHTIKYEGTDGELHRILKTGGRAIFFEGGAGNPLIALARSFTIKDSQGDVPLNFRRITKFSKKFSRLTIEGYFFLYMLKRLGYYSSDESLPDKGKNKLGKTLFFRFFLQACLAFDQAFINKKSPKISGRYLIEFQK